MRVSSDRELELLAREAADDGLTTSGAARTPSATMIAHDEREDRADRARDAVRLLVVASRSSALAYTGMNDAESAPSPNRFCRKLVMRNAPLNASATRPAPR